jgi:class 3 adenylate cyclase/tetratricopeptide (TPR) repeat protein
VDCPSCRAPNDPDSLFCESCGGALERTCATCGGTSKPTAHFCRQCGQAFEAPASDQQETSLPPSQSATLRRDYTPRHLAEKILSTKSAIEGERKQVTVFFADVKSSMQLAEELGAEEWHSILERFFEILSEGVHRFEGTVNQYTGDGVMALFGAPVAHEDHAHRACYAALYLSDALKTYTDQLRVDRGLNFSVRMGINSGEVVVGKIGDDLRMDYTAQGHTVGLAQRMEALAEPGKAMLSGSTIDIVEGYFELHDLGETKLKGVEQPVRVAELQGVGGMRTRLDRSRARGLSKFVGRDEEMARLESSLERALAGDGQVVGVVAEAGSGKSRLSYEFLESCRARNITIRTTTGVPHGLAVPLEPVLLLYREIFGIVSEDDDEQARRKIAGSIAQISAEELPHLPLLYEFMRVPDPSKPSPDHTPEQHERELMDVLRRLTIARSRLEPAVIVFEDLHWVDPQTDTVIEWIVDAAASTRTLLLVNFRPEYRAEWMSRSHYQQIAVRPLDSAAIGELLGEWLGPHPSLEGFADLVRDRTGGNPFFMEEVVQSQIEAGALVGSRGRFELAHPIENLKVPVSVQSLLAARIDLLGEETKQLLQTAAVIGDEVPDSLLAEVSSLDPDALRMKLRELVQGEFLYEAALYPNLEYAFKHPLTREVAYGSLLRDRRQSIHAAVAKALEAAAGSSPDAEAALLAHHWELAGRGFEAARWQSVAAERLGMSHAVEALFHWRKVIELLDDAAGAPAALALRGQARAQVIYMASRSAQSHEDVVALFDAARRELGDSDSRELAVTLYSYALARNGAGHFHDACSIVSEAIEMARRIGDHDLLVAALGNACVVFGPWEDPHRVIAASDEIEALYAKDPSLSIGPLAKRPLVISRSMRKDAYTASGRASDVAAILESLRSVAAGSDDPLERAIFHWAVTRTCAPRGDVARALEESRQGLEWAGRSSNAMATALGDWARGEALLAAGRPDEAVPHLERAVTIAVDRAINRPVSALLLSLLCDARIALGEPDEACRVAQKAIDMATDMDVVHESAYGQLAMARACLAVGIDALPQADAALERTAHLLREIPWSHLHPHLEIVRAGRAGLQGDESARETALREAHRLFVEAGEPELAEQVERRLSG